MRYTGITLTAAERRTRNQEIRDQARCGGDDRFTEPNQSPEAIHELIEICKRCPVMLVTPSFASGCLDWAKEQRLPVGFVVAGGERWRVWTACDICGRKCRGLPRCNEHGGLEPDLNTDDAEIDVPA